MKDSVLQERLRVDPYANDPGRWGHSFANLADIFVPCLDIVDPNAVLEIGAYAGDLTRVLLRWASERNARVIAVDPEPQAALIELSEQCPELQLIRSTSLEALRSAELPEAVIIDGDHNYYTVYHELKAIASRRSGRDFPLVMLHDVSWPHGWRDAYYAPERIPEEWRQPITEGGGLVPGVRGTRPGGLPYKWVASHEGGERNGVRAALEDFVTEQQELRVAIIGAFFGFGVLWHRDVPWARRLEELMARWSGNSMIERLERNRVWHLAATHTQRSAIYELECEILRAEDWLRRLEASRIFRAVSALRDAVRAIGRRRALRSRSSPRDAKAET